MRFLIKLLIKRRAAHQAEEDLLFLFQIRMKLLMKKRVAHQIGEALLSYSISNQASFKKEGCPSGLGGSPFFYFKFELSFL